MNKNNKNSIYLEQNNSHINCCKLGRELFNNSVNNNIINENFKSINDELYICNHSTFNFHNNPQLFLNNYFVDMVNYININNNINTNIFNLNNNNLFFINGNIYMNNLLNLLRKKYYYL